MVGWLYGTDGRLRRLRPEKVSCRGMPLLAVAVPQGKELRGAKLLCRRGVRRVLTDPALPAAALSGLAQVSPLPLCRAKAPELIQTLLSHIPLHSRCVALCGERADPAAWALAQALCPQVGKLLLCFQEGGASLTNALRTNWGMACRPPGLVSVPQVRVELSPSPPGPGSVLCLWGEPELQGLTLSGPFPIPPALPALPFLELLWETGRLSLGEIFVKREGGDPLAF